MAKVDKRIYKLMARWPSTDKITNIYDYSGQTSFNDSRIWGSMNFNAEYPNLMIGLRDARYALTQARAVVRKKIKRGERPFVFIEKITMSDALFHNNFWEYSKTRDHLETYSEKQLEPYLIWKELSKS